MPDEHVPEYAAAYCAGILMGFQIFANAAARSAGVHENLSLPPGFLAQACHVLRQQIPGLVAFNDREIIHAAQSWHANHPVRG